MSSSFFDVYRPSEEAFYKLNEVAQYINLVAVDKGFWSKDRTVNDAEKIALMHSELSEVLEVIRTVMPKGEILKSEKVPEINAIDEELADTIIRILDYCNARGINIGKAVYLKAGYNETRTYKHGKKF